MKVLLIGSGGREHALAHQISKSNMLTQLYIAPGNAGTGNSGENITLNASDFSEVADFVEKNNIDLVVVGPEDPLVKGITNYLKENPGTSSVPVIGPSLEGAMLEGSKEFAKEFMFRHDIPTAGYKSITNDTLGIGYEFLEELKPPYVLKADGLAAGKGVLIIDELEEAKIQLEAMLNGKFGEASKTVVIEEHLSGIELSVFVLTDGDSYIILPEAKDYKRIGEGDTGLNTGGMGAVSPVPFADQAFLKKVEDRIVKPTVNGLKKDQIDYKGFIFIGLMNEQGDPKVIEYNVRMGDPESQVVLPRIKTDLLQLLDSAAKQKLNERRIEIDDRTATTVVTVSGGYPEDYNKGLEIKGLDRIKESIVFHAGTAVKENKIVTSGGRVLAVTSFGENIHEALKKSYASIEEVHYERKYFRKDIGFDL
jgi:phosphoribosylamine--glycine ligase